jgi:hypothetical protein
VPDQLLDALATGRFAHVPVLIGTNQNEGVPFVYGAVSKPVDELEVLAFMAVLFGARSTELVAPFCERAAAPRPARARTHPPARRQL